MYTNVSIILKKTLHTSDFLKILIFSRTLLKLKFKGDIPQTLSNLSNENRQGYIPIRGSLTCSFIPFIFLQG